MKISVAIVNYNTERLLEDCLASLVRLKDPLELEIIVVDNNSADGSCAMVESRFPQVKLIRNPRNAGFAAANNIAYRHSSGTYFVLLNSDTVVADGTLLRMADFLEQSPRVAAVGPTLITGEQIIQASGQAFPTLFTELLHLFRISGLLSDRRLRTFAAKRLSFLFPRSVKQLLLNYAQPEQDREVDWLTGACIMLRREALEQVGLLDETFFLDYEDVDLCYRIQQSGWQLYLLHTVPVLHLFGASKRRNYSRSFYEKYRSMFIYFKKHHGRGAVVTLKASTLLLSGLAVLGSVVPVGRYRERREAYLQLIRLCREAR